MLESDTRYPGNIIQAQGVKYGYILVALSLQRDEGRIGSQDGGVLVLKATTRTRTHVRVGALG